MSTLDEQQKNKDAALNEAFQLVQKNAQYVWDQLEEDIEPPSALLSFNGEDLIFGNSIVLIQGKEGSHKSRLAGAITTLLLSDDTGKTLLGFKKTTDQFNTTVYMDTERNKTHQLPLMLKQVYRDCGLDKDELKKRLILAPLSEVKRADRIYVMGKIFGSIPKEENKSIVIILDIVSDFIQDFNNLGGTNELLDVMLQSASKRDITFIVVIHENPGMADKARGHLGTELANKAATILQIGATNVPDVFKIMVKKSRTTAKPPLMLLRFDDEANTLIPVTDESLATSVADPDQFRLCQALADNYFHTMGRTELLEILENSLRWSLRKIEDKLKGLIETKVEFETPLGRTQLIKLRGKLVEYKMIPLDLPDGPIKNQDAQSIVIETEETGK